MTTAKFVLMGLVALGAPAMVFGQIYESKDAEGVTEFSDVPTPKSEVVDLQKTNVADEPADVPAAAVGVRPTAKPAQAPAGAGTGAQVSEEPAYIVYGADDDNHLKRPRPRRDNDHVEHHGPAGGVVRPAAGGAGPR